MHPIQPKPNLEPADVAFGAASILLEAAEDDVEITAHFLMGSVSCIANPDAVSISCCSTEGSVFFVADGRGDCWLVTSLAGCPGRPARQILASDESDVIALECLQLLAGTKHRPQRTERLH